MFLAEIFIAVAATLLGTALSEKQAQSADARASRETYVRQLYAAIKDRYGVTYDQLNQLANNLDIKLNLLKEATKGSARLSIASRKLQAFVQQYPDRVNEINQAKNEISNLMNAIQAQADVAASKIQNREGYSNYAILQDVVADTARGNEIITTLNDKTGSNQVSTTNNNDAIGSLKDNTIPGTIPTQVYDDAMSKE